MHVSQLDIAHMEDVEVKLLVLQMDAAAQPTREPMRSFWLSLRDALIRALQERRLAVAVFDTELLNVHEDGGLVEAGDDPVGDALRELRGEGGEPV